MGSKQARVLEDTFPDRHEYLGACARVSQFPNRIPCWRTLGVSATGAASSASIDPLRRVSLIQLAHRMATATVLAGQYQFVSHST